MIPFHYAIRDAFVEKSICLNTLKKKERINTSKEFIQWAQIKISELHLWLKNHEFENDIEEIEFFKEIKPAVISKLFFHKELLRLETSIPSGKKTGIKYLEDELSKISSNQTIDSKFYSYYRSLSNELDQEYFTRKTCKNKLETDCYQIDYDNRISTYYDNKIAVILTHDALIPYIEKRIKKLSKKKLKEKLKINIPNQLSKLYWTGTKTELTELVYALHYSKVINEGNSDLKEIAKEIGKLFNIDITENMYRVFIDIKNRKNPNSKFLQYLVDTFQKKLIEEKI